MTFYMRLLLLQLYFINLSVNIFINFVIKSMFNIYAIIIFRYNKPVQNIRWDPRPCPYSNRGSVLCCDGQEIPCDCVICTVSLGVLKAQAETLFSPELPAAKLEALHNIGFGHVNYIFLEYETPFWGPGEGIIKVNHRYGLFM